MHIMFPDKRRLTLAVLTGLGVAVVAAGSAHAEVVSSLPGGTWSVHPDTTAGGSAEIVSGPGTPPAGTGSLELTVDSTSDIVLVSTDLGELTARPLSDLTASYSTYVPEGGGDGHAPSLRIVALRDGTPGSFTTISVEPRLQGTVVPGQWQPWTLDDESTVWQTNSPDGFCVLGDTCTFAEYKAEYPQAVWGQIQLGIGSGVPAGSGFVDAVTINDGDTTLFTDFDPPPPSPSPSPTSPAPSPQPTPLPVTGSGPEVLASVLAGVMFVFAGVTVVLLVGRRRPANGPAGPGGGQR